MDTFSGQVANALVIQIELNLQMSISVNFAIGFGCRPLLDYKAKGLLLLFVDAGVHNLQIGS